ncbi:hypothetical protein C8F04DRAFT_493042 [Mycena alexandri]|uniref:Uncharacterized protein n=1 Tax=Mycena alexandri TaxID=1745969 RepID=A0AAD6WKD6_9AGAR|nr:hypothetical protein C8F04DRAFT_493042 [Mycena alexandri]
MADDDERAAKAARAKAMLKKRQQKKTGTSGVTSPISPPPSRAFTPAPAEPVDEEKRDLGDVFNVSKDEPDWLTGLARAPSPPPPAAPVPAKSPPPPAATSPQNALPRRTSLTSPPQAGKEVVLQKQLSALQAENEALAGDLARLKPLEARMCFLCVF